jgi:hypothetical protein
VSGRKTERKHFIKFGTVARNIPELEEQTSHSSDRPEIQKRVGLS